MAPTPKRKHSTRRTGKRRASKKTNLPQIVYDKKTGRPRLAHRNMISVPTKSTASSATQSKKAAEEAPKKAQKKNTPKKDEKAVK